MVYEDIHFHDRSKEAQKISRQISRWHNEVFLFGPILFHRWNYLKSQLFSLALSPPAPFLIPCGPTYRYMHSKIYTLVHFRAFFLVRLIAYHGNLGNVFLKNRTLSFVIVFIIRQKIGFLDVIFCAFYTAVKGHKMFFPSGKNHIDCA